MGYIDTHDGGRDDPARVAVWSFLRHAVIWSAALALLTTALNWVRFPHVTGRPGAAIEYAVSSFALFLTFTSFAGGLAAHRAVGPRGSRAASLAGGVVLALVIFALSAHVVPRLEIRSMELSGMDVERLQPFGPETPGTKLEHLRYLRENPPRDPSLSVEDPLERSIAWVEFLFHQEFVIPLVAVVYGLLGHLFGQLTDPLGPSRRRHVRWMVGVALVPAFIAPANRMQEYVYANPLASAVLPAWGMLVTPLFLLAAVWGVTHAWATARVRLENRVGREEAAERTSRG